VAPAALAAAPATAPAAELVGHAILPADTFADGTPPAGAFDDDGRRREAPAFALQPVQGVSSIEPGPRRGTWWALSDNGFATSANSSDYRTAIYLFEVEPRTRARDPRAAAAGRVRLLERIELRDPQRRFPWRLVEESSPARPLTGADVDPESLVVAADGSFWIGDEVGPWLLHFDRAGTLLEAPVDLRIGEATIRSVNHPLVRAGRATAQARASKGFEGLAPGQPGQAGQAATLLAMLEGTLPGDAPGALRILEFDVARRAWTGRGWTYTMDDPSFAIAELAPGRNGRYLVIERDELHGPAARFKRIFEIDPAGAEPLRKTPLVDLLAIRDPRRLASGDGRFTFPYWTTESVELLDPRQLLVVNDNNFPATGGRAPGVRDSTEWIWLRIP
jgi:glycerophosphoryl diester phosphodiesterase